MSITNVAVVGGSGNLGPAVVRELVAAGFTVTAVTRASSQAAFPEGVAVKRVDFESAEAVRDAFRGQDAVVSTVATAAVGQQTALVDAAVAAGVRRFIPSDFGVNTREVADKPVGRLLAQKVAVVDYLIAKQAERPSFEWTSIASGIFVDWTLKNNLIGFDLANRKATVVDSGKQKWQASTLAQVGRAVAAVLQRAEATANRYLETASFNVSANEIIAAAEKALGAGGEAKFDITHVDSAALAKSAEDKLAMGNFGGAFVDLLQVHIYADDKGWAYLDPERCANDELGLAWESVDDVVAEVIKGL